MWCNCYLTVSGSRFNGSDTKCGGEYPYDEEIFLDDISLQELSHTLGVPVIPVANDGAELLETILGEAL